MLGNVLKDKAAKSAPGARSAVARITILGADGVQQTFDGTLVGMDQARDLVVVQVNAPAALLKPIPLGSSQELKVGQQCLAIGNPFGFDHTLTTGNLVFAPSQCHSGET